MASSCFLNHRTDRQSVVDSHWRYLIIIIIIIGDDRSDYRGTLTLLLYSYGQYSFNITYKCYISIVCMYWYWYYKEKKKYMESHGIPFHVMFFALFVDNNTYNNRQTVIYVDLYVTTFCRKKSLPSFLFFPFFHLFFTVISLILNPILFSYFIYL